MKDSCRAIRFIFLSFGLCISSWAPMIPIVKSRLQLDDAELGLVLLVFGIGALIMMPITGWIINKVGSRLMTLLSGIAMIIVLPFLAISETAFDLSCTLFLFGITTGAMNVSMNAQSVDIEKSCNTPILSGVHGWFSIGGLLGVGLVSLLLSFKLPLVYCIIAVSSIISLILITQWRHLIPSLPNPITKINNPDGSNLYNNQVLILGALCFIAFMAEGSMLDWSAEFLRTNMEYDASTAGIGYAIFSIAMAFGRSIGDRMIQRFSSTQVFQAGSFIAALGIIIVVSTSWSYFELVGFFLIGLGASNIVPILFSCSGKQSEIPSNTALTIITTCGYVGLLAGPAFIGFLADAISLSLALTAIAFLLAGIGLYGSIAIPITTKQVSNNM